MIVFTRTGWLHPRFRPRRLGCRSAAAVWLLGAMWSAAAAQSPITAVREAVLVDGEPFPAALESLDGDWNATLRAGDQRRVVAARDLVRWGEYRDASDSTLIILSDGGVLAAEVLDLRDERLEVHSRLWGDVSLPVARVRGIVFDPPVDALRRDRLWARILAAAGGHDQLWLENGDVASGNVLGLRPARGAAGDLSVVLSTQGRELTMPIDQLDALVFNPALVDAAKPRESHAWLGFQDGSLLCVVRITPRDQTSEVRLSGAGALTTAATSRLLEAITYLRPANERVEYLSDGKPASFRHVPFLETEWPLAADRSVSGGRLRARGVIHDKGLGMHSTARAAYDLNGRYRRFAAQLAIDDAAGLSGSVTFRVFLDDAAGGWKQAYESPVIRGGTPPVPLSLDVANARRLALIVDFADRGDTLDHADWLDARLVR